jgi:SAM-dependent methyltransferase
MTDQATFVGLNRDSTAMLTDTGNTNQFAREAGRARPLIINLGCGVKTGEPFVNIDWSIYILLSQNRWLLPLVAPVIGRDRVQRIKDMRGKTIYHNLRKGIPFPNNSADAVYHSHVMEHIDRDAVLTFQKEIFRVLKPGGLQRLCLPNLEQLVSEYNKSLATDDLTREASVRHDRLIADILEQSVRRASAGARQRSSFRRWLENLTLGDARARGETHQWMWDRLNARAVLMDAGFTDIKVRSMEVSEIEGWQQTRMEVYSDGSEYHPGSLYLECRKPASN